jgi:peroxiredoxin
MALKQGDKAPEFKLYNTEKKEISLSDKAGKPFLLMFFPLAFTGTCTTQLCTTRDDLGFYNKLNADVAAVSVDSLFSLKKYKEEQGLQFDLLSDFNKEVSKAYGALYDEFILGMKGVSKRSAFVIDGKGVIQYAEVLENAGDLPDFAAIKRCIESLK